jgi:flavin reductase (DIM6/NTAB) family NADH-FMN oxidoreductase RutF
MMFPPEKTYRLLSPRLLTLITTVNSKSGMDAMPADFISPITFNPPIVLVSFKPLTHTYQNVIHNKEFVINILGKEHLDQVLRCGTRYQEGLDKLQQVGLHSYSSRIIDSPRVKEAKAWIECRVLEEKKFGDHVAVFAEVITSEIRDDLVGIDGDLDPAKINPILHFTKDNFVVDLKIAKHKRYDR